MLVTQLFIKHANWNITPFFPPLACATLAGLLGVWSSCVWAGVPNLVNGGHDHGASRLVLLDDSDRSELTIKVGPFTLSPGAQHVHVRHNFVFPFSGWFLSYTPRVLNADGSDNSMRLLHHVDLIRPIHRDLNLRRMPEHFFIAGSELRPWPAIDGYGYPVIRGGGAMFYAHLVNNSSRLITSVFVEVKIRYQLQQVRPAPTSVVPVWFFAGVKQSFDVPPGFSETTRTTIFSKTGRLVGLGGHLHDFGRTIRLENLSKNQVIANLDAMLDEQGHFESLPVKIFDRPGFQLTAGDRLRITATYDNPARHVLEKAGMGAIGAYFVPAVK